MRFYISFKTLFFIALLSSIYVLYIWVKNTNITLQESVYSFMKTTISEPRKDVQQKVYSVTPKTTLTSKLEMKYILQWTNPKSVPFVYMGLGQSGYFERNCTYTNC